jgi:hypothetical protein
LHLVRFFFMNFTIMHGSTKIKYILLTHLQYIIVEYLGIDEVVIIDCCVRMVTFFFDLSLHLHRMESVSITQSNHSEILSQARTCSCKCPLFVLDFNKKPKYVDKVQ